MTDLNQYSIGIDITNIDNICRFWSRERGISGVLESNNKTYITSDIHGDMNSLLNFLIKSGFAFFPRGSSIIIEKTLSDGTKMKIPNLNVNVYFKGNLAILGDLFDRGKYSRECFELVKDIIRQCKEIEKSGRPGSEKFSERFTYLLGNHEQNVIVDDFELSSMNSWVGSREDFDRMRADLIAMMESGDIKFSKDLGNGLYGSHVAFKREDIHCLFDFLKTQSETDEHFAAIYNEYNWLDEAVRSKINKEEAGELSIFLNELAIELLGRLAKDSSKSYLYLPILNVLLFNKTLQSNREDIIDGFFQAVGHEAIMNHYAMLGPCTVYMDCLQSSGFKEYVNNLSHPTFFIYNGVEIKTISMFRSKDNENYRHMVSQHFAVPYMFRDYITPIN